MFVKYIIGFKKYSKYCSFRENIALQTGIKTLKDSHMESEAKASIQQTMNEN